MIFWVSRLIASLFGLDISKVQRWVLVGFGILALIAILFVTLRIRSCYSKRQITINQQQLQKLNDANEAKRRAELQQIITENVDIIKTVDGRNTIAEVSENERQAQIYSRIQEADRKIMEARSRGKDITGPELDCLLVPENCPQQ